MLNLIYILVRRGKTLESFFSFKSLIFLFKKNLASKLAKCFYEIFYEVKAEGIKNFPRYKKLSFFIHHIILDLKISFFQTFIYAMHETAMTPPGKCRVVSNCKHT